MSQAHGRKARTQIWPQIGERTDTTGRVMISEMSVDTDFLTEYNQREDKQPAVATKKKAGTPDMSTDMLYWPRGTDARTGIGLKYKQFTNFTEIRT